MKGLIDSLQMRIGNLQGIIGQYQGKDSIQAKIVETYKDEIRSLEGQVAIYKHALQSLEAKYQKDLKRERRKRFWTAAAGVAGMIGVAYVCSQ
jgi:hypothetical protein